MYIPGLVETRPLEKDLSSTYATREGLGIEYVL